MGIESTDGKALRAAADCLFRLDLKRGMTFDDAARLASILNGQIEAFGQSWLPAPAGNA